MYLSPKIEEAIKCVSHLHRDQVRKDALATPYVSHLFSVMLILSQYTEDEDILIAGLFHDSLEDVPEYTYEKLVKDTNDRVASIVKGVTEDLNPNIPDIMQTPWLRRKEGYLQTLREGSLESLYVSLADKTHNIRSMIPVIRDESGEQMHKFHGSMKNMIWFFDEIEKIAKERITNGENLLLSVMSKELQELKAINGQL